MSGKMKLAGASMLASFFSLPHHVSAGWNQSNLAVINQDDTHQGTRQTMEQRIRLRSHDAPLERAIMK